MPALLAALLALALTTPADAAPKRKARPVCVQIWDPGVGPMRICEPKLR
ncbi:hypothetical protein QO016_004756 [Methylobacterium persicinum]|uniref:Uncharacterized protein n=1 Tax=Methylobacterium persicinum TaxID=374426 RepID=A0ABU0HUP8_9HYPH|nr:hypothetical protein [Methylobacterium persicinum]GJE37854.1 hypothetical protein KHHGKMAE_1916 [Methylobacterium persicinum]